MTEPLLKLLLAILHDEELIRLCRRLKKRAPDLGAKALEEILVEEIKARDGKKEHQWI